MGQQPRHQGCLWVTHYLAISFVWLAGSLLEASMRLRGWGQGRRRPLSSIAPPGRGRLWDQRAFYVAGGLPTRDANPRLEPHKDSAWRRHGKMFAALPGQESKRPPWERHVVPIRRSSAPSPLNEHIFMKSEN